MKISNKKLPHEKRNIHRAKITLPNMLSARESTYKEYFRKLF